MRVPDELQGKADSHFIIRFTCDGFPTLEKSFPLSVLAAIKPSNEGLRMAGEWAIENKEWRKAIDWLTEAYTREPGNHDIRWSYGRALTMCSKTFKQPDIQIAVVKAIISEGDEYLKRVDVLDSLAAAYEFKQDWKQAQEWNDRILVIESGNGGAKDRDQRIRKALGLTPPSP